MKTRSRNIPVSGRETESDFEKPNTLHHLFEENLQDIYDAEMQIVDTFSEFAEAAENRELKEGLLDHMEETKNHVERIERVFSRLNIPQTKNSCEGMQGLIEESREVISHFEEGPVRDAALIIGIQKIEHYEIAAYGSLCEIADVLGLNRTKDLLGRSLDEEKDFDELLTDIAQEVNDEACVVSATEEAY